MVSADASFPVTLADLVRARVGSLEAGVQSALLATACLAAPTVELVAHAVGTDAGHVVGLLEHAESKGIVGINGHQIRFTHPLLARGVYTGATPGAAPRDASAPGGGRRGARVARQAHGLGRHER